MFVFKIISIVVSVHFVWSLTATDEDQFLNQQLMKHFGVLTEEISGIGDNNSENYQKREASEVADEGKKYSSLLSPTNFTRSHHYWTRKRGREKTSQPSTDNYNTLYPTRSYGLNTISSNKSRKKREAIKTFLKRYKVSKNIKREIELEVNSTENKNNLIVTNISSEIPTTEVPLEHSIPKHDHDHHGHGSHDKNLYQRRKINKCCAEDQDFPGFNESLRAINAQCLAETWRNRQNVSDEDLEGDGGLYTMFSCENLKRWKTLTTCTIDCFAQKLGIFDSNGIISMDVAKRVVSENFAFQEWEQEASGELIEKCSNELTVSTSKPVNAFGFQCNSKPAEFFYCMWREMFLICPIDKQQKTKECEKMRSVLTKFSDNKFSNN